jgi:hypothetical protein
VTVDFKRGYSRGYQAGIRGRWPDHTPPNPPTPEVLALFVAAKDLRDAAFGLLQVIIADDGPDGPFVTLETEANKVDNAFQEISKWLKTQE